MQRRNMIAYLGAALLPGGLLACGGAGQDKALPPAAAILGASADRSSYKLGERATVTVRFTGGNAVLQPGQVPLVSDVPALSAPLDFSSRLRVVMGALEREIPFTPGYAEQWRTISGVERAGHCALALGAHGAFILGGEDAAGRLATTVLRFDPAAETFAPAGALAAGRAGHTATPLGAAAILLLGGVTAASAPVAELYDAALRLARLPAGQPAIARWAHSATALADGRIVIAGGMTATGAAPAAALELYDPASERFLSAGVGLNVARHSHSATALPDGGLLVYGGVTPAGAAAPPEMVDLKRGVATLLPAMEQAARCQHAVLPEPGGKVLIVGGHDYLSGLPVLAGLLFDPVTGQASPAGALPGGQARGAVTALADGRLLAVGGYADALTTAAPWCALGSSTGANWQAGPRLAVARSFHSATLLPGGRVLVVGGNGADRRIVGSAELFG